MTFLDDTRIDEGWLCDDRAGASFDDILISPGDNMDKSEENQISDENATGVTE